LPKWQIHWQFGEWRSNKQLIRNNILKYIFKFKKLFPFLCEFSHSSNCFLHLFCLFGWTNVDSLAQPLARSIVHPKGIPSQNAFLVPSQIHNPVRSWL
jgi:hypothetical protein